MSLFLNQDILVPLFSFIILLSLCIIAIRIFNKQPKNKEIVKKIQKGAGFHDHTNSDDKKKISDKASTKNPFVSFFSLFGKKPGEKESSDYKALEIKFLKAGIQWKNIYSAFWGAKLFLPIFSIAVFFALKIFMFTTMTATTTIAAIAFFALFGFYLPELWLKNKTDKRKKLLLTGLPDTLDMLVVCVEAGMGLDSALDRVGREMKIIYPDLSHEFSLMNLEMRAGKQRDDALRNLALRTDLDEMSSLVTLLIQTNKFGTSIAAALKIFSASFRTKRSQKAEEIAARLPVTIMIPLILFIFPSMFVIILGPAAISIYQNLMMK